MESKCPSSTAANRKSSTTNPKSTAVKPHKSTAGKPPSSPPKSNSPAATPDTSSNSPSSTEKPNSPQPTAAKPDNSSTTIGHVFLPTDADILELGNIRKSGQALTVVRDINMYSDTPDVLFENEYPSIKHKNTYLVWTPREPKGLGFDRDLRTPKGGYWYPRGGKKKIEAKEDVEGYYRILRLYAGGKGGKGGKLTDWWMREFFVSEGSGDQYVICTVVFENSEIKGLLNKLKVALEGLERAAKPNRSYDLAPVSRITRSNSLKLKATDAMSTTSGRVKKSTRQAGEAMSSTVMVVRDPKEASRVTPPLAGSSESIKPKTTHAMATRSGKRSTRQADEATSSTAPNLAQAPLVEPSAVPLLSQKQRILQAYAADMKANAYVPGQSSMPVTSTKPTFKHIPKKGMLVFNSAQFDGILKKISEFNNALLSDPDQQSLSLNDAETSRLGAIAKILKDASHYHTSKFSDDDISLLFKLLKSWPVPMMFPVIDVLRMVILHRDGLAVLKNDGNDIFMELIKKVTSSPLEPNLLTSLRAVVNLFKNSGYHLWLQKRRAEIFDAFASCYLSPKKSVQVSYSTLVLNYAVLLIDKKDEEGQAQVLSAALAIAEGETLEVDAKYRALVAIGSLMLEGLVKKTALDLEVGSVAEVAKASKDSKVAEVGADIETLVKQS